MLWEAKTPLCRSLLLICGLAATLVVMFCQTKQLIWAVSPSTCSRPHSFIITHIPVLILLYRWWWKIESVSNISQSWLQAQLHDTNGSNKRAAHDHRCSSCYRLIQAGCRARRLNLALVFFMSSDFVLHVFLGRLLRVDLITLVEKYLYVRPSVRPRKVCLVSM